MEPPRIDSILDAANAADAVMLAALKAAKTICRKALNELHLTETPAVGAIVAVGRRHLELIAVSPAGRLSWRDVDRGSRFTSGRSGRLPLMASPDERPRCDHFSGGASGLCHWRHRLGGVARRDDPRIERGRQPRRSSQNRAACCCAWALGSYRNARRNNL